MKVQFKHTYGKRKNVLVNLPTVFPHVFCNLADRCSVKTNQEIMKFTGKKNHTHSYSGPGISEKTKETNQLCQLKAVKIGYAHSKFRILHALCKQQKPLLIKLTLRSLKYHKLNDSLLSRAMSHVWPVNTLFQIRLITNCVRFSQSKTSTYVLATLRDLNTMFCTNFADTLYRRFRVSATMQAMDMVAFTRCACCE